MNGAGFTLKSIRILNIMFRKENKMYDTCVYFFSTKYRVQSTKIMVFMPFKIYLLM